MKTFNEWLNQKVWKLNKKDIITHWSQIPPGKPMGIIRTVPAEHQGSAMSYDGLRVTGSTQWIDFVLSRLRDVLSYENEKTRLQLVYKQQIDRKTEMGRPNSYIFYMQAKDREAPKQKLDFSTLQPEKPS